MQAATAGNQSHERRVSHRAGCSPPLVSSYLNHDFPPGNCSILLHIVGVDWFKARFVWDTG